MTKYAIIGYGNLGREMANLLNTKGEDYIVFSRRQSEYIGDRILPLDALPNIKIDIAFLCCGSANDSIDIAPYVATYCNTVDCYDNHEQIEHYLSLLRVKAQQGKVCIVGAGWDPGLLSLQRTLFSLVGQPYTFWGSGISRGHSNALLSVSGVADGISFTIPCKKALKQSKRGIYSYSSTSAHRRLCYVVLGSRSKNDCSLIKPSSVSTNLLSNGNKIQLDDDTSYMQPTRVQESVSIQKRRIVEEIKSIPDYFLGYCVKVRFISQKKLRKLSNKAHKGRVIATNNCCSCDFSLSTNDNASLTAHIMYCYAKILNKLSFGVYTPLDIPFSLFADGIKYL